MRDLVGFLRWGSGGGKEKDRAALEEAEVERLAEKEEDVGRLPGFRFVLNRRLSCREVLTDFPAHTQQWSAPSLTIPVSHRRRKV